MNKYTANQAMYNYVPIVQEAEKALPVPSALATRYVIKEYSKPSLIRLQLTRFEI
jgi:hypothetical protein